MKINWLWDRKITFREAAKILRDPDHDKFLSLAALFLSRNNVPREVFKNIDRKVFCQNWSGIKKIMRRNTWNDPRIIFWQAIYEKLLDDFRRKGIKFTKREKAAKPFNELSKDIGDTLRDIRKEKKLTQAQLAEKLGVSQQIISRIEKGRENVTISTLKEITKALRSNLKITIQN